MSIDSMSPEDRKAHLSVSVENETNRLNRGFGAENAPFGGWRNAAVAIVAERENVNPYTLDHLIRGVA